jgi:hypothetical protein
MVVLYLEELDFDPSHATNILASNLCVPNVYASSERRHRAEIFGFLHVRQFFRAPQDIEAPQRVGAPDYGVLPGNFR